MLSLRILLYRRKLFLECFRFFVFHLAEIVGDELLGGAAVPAGVLHFPALAEDAKLFGRKDYAAGSKMVVDDGQVFVLVWSTVVDNQAETIG